MNDPAERFSAIIALESRSSEAPSLTIRLLGPFELFVGDAPVSAERWPRRKPKSLVKLLALQPRRQLHREQIIDLLWPDADFDAATNNLHKAIHAARRALEPDLKSGSRSQFIITRDNLVELNAPGGVNVDAGVFERRAAAALRSNDPKLFEAALDLYRGDLLPEVLYEDWAVAPRERLRGLYIDLLYRLSRLREESGDYIESAGLLRSLVDADPTNEEAHQRLMRLHALTGNRRGAVEQYRRLVEVLRDEVGVEPDPTTVELYERVSAQTANGAAAQEEVAEKLYLNLTGADKQTVSGRQMRNEEALELYLKGRYCWLSRSGKRMLQAAGYFEQAIAKDPGYALAWSGLADAYNLMGSHGVLAPGMAFNKAMGAAKRALELDPNLAEAHAAMGCLCIYTLDFDSGHRSLRRALDLKPRAPIIRQWYGISLITFYNEVERGLAEIRLALQLDPVSILNRATLGWLLFFARRYDEAIEVAQQAIELDPNLHFSHLYCGRILWGKGMFEEAVDSFQQAAALSNGHLAIQVELIAARAMAGDRDGAAHKLYELEAASSGRYLPPCYLALVHLALGDDEKALDALDVAYRERSGQLFWLNVDPRFDRLREYSRFRDLLRRIGH